MKEQEVADSKKVQLIYKLLVYLKGIAIYKRVKNKSLTGFQVIFDFNKFQYISTHFDTLKTSLKLHSSNENGFHNLHTLSTALISSSCDIRRSTTSALPPSEAKCRRVLLYYIQEELNIIV